MDSERLNNQVAYYADADERLFFFFHKQCLPPGSRETPNGHLHLSAMSLENAEFLLREQETCIPDDFAHRDILVQGLRSLAQHLSRPLREGTAESLRPRLKGVDEK